MHRQSRRRKIWRIKHRMLGRRDDAGSGLRAGFVRGDGLGQPQGRNTAPRPEPETPEKDNKALKSDKPASDSKSGNTQPAKETEKPQQAPDAAAAADLDSPTITMQGVSGKKITGVVKVVKAHRPEKKAEAEKPVQEEAVSRTEQPSVEKPESVTEQPPVVSTTPSQPAKAETQAEPAPKATDTRAEPAGDRIEGKPMAAEPKTPAAAMEPSSAPAAAAPAPAAASAARPQPDRTYSPRPQSDRPQGPRPQGDRPYSPRPQGDRPYGDRPQGDRPYSPRPQGDRPYGDRPQGDRPYSPRPQGDRPYGDRPQSDRPYSPRPQGDRPYSPRPQGDRPYSPRPQGDRPYNPRPQGDRPYGDRPQGDRPYGDRPQGDRPYSPRPQGQRTGGRGRPAGAAPSDDLREKLPEPPRNNIAARETFEKNAKRDDKHDVRKESVKSVQDTRDKHKSLRQQAAVLSGTDVSKALNDETVLDTLYIAPAPAKAKPSGRAPRGGRGRGQQPAPTPVVRAVLTHVTIPENLTVKEFAEAIKKTSAEVIKKLIKMGMMATVNQEIDFDTASLVAEEFGITCEKLVEVTEEEILFDDTDDKEENLKTRPPVVVVMGHVDHGKTSILDRIRSANVVSGEAGGITQHIGAYTVRANGRQITFLDTPGHEAFTTMRARGAQVTDIAILVVAADDGVMPQTVEAINHAKAANTQIVVAINKIDKEGANLDRVKQELATRELIPEEWGGTTVMVPVSAKTGQGIDELLEMVLLTADILDLKADPDKQAKGTVIEAKLDKNRGPVATVLVQRGTLRTGDTLVTGSIIGHVRAMVDDKGSTVKKAGPSIPVEILGLPEVPEAGELFYAVTDDKVARALVEKRRVNQREQQLRASSRMSLETLYAQMATGEVKDLNILVKADVQGSVEAVRQSLEKLTSPEVRINVIHGAVGAITESDIRLAEVSNAIVIGFNVRPAANVADMAKDNGVDVRMYRVIYNAIEDIQAAMKGMLAPTFKEVVLGHAEVRQLFKVSGVGTIAGCYVTDGKILRACDIRLVRDGIVIHEGKLSSLKRFKDDVREVATGYECGLSIERFNDLKEGDVIEAFEMKEVERS